MIRISDTVYNIIKSKPYLEYALSKGLVNISALARELKPEVEAACLKPVTTGAITMALNRLEPTIIQQFETSNVRGKLHNVIVRSGLVECTFLNSDTLFDKITQLINLYHETPHSFFTLTRGTFETTLIASSASRDDIFLAMKTEKLVKEIDNLSSITIKLDQSVLHNPGTYYEVLKALAWEGINVIEVFSTYRELVVLFDSSVIDESFRVLKHYFFT